VFETKHRPKRCPKCGSKRIARIQWGMPNFSDELKRELDQGTVVLGGCIVSDRDPSWTCPDCGAPIFRVRGAEPF
jgi:predicted RNA-binding Zn-ribbon protein involved in translation (DUF1610 family)